MEPLTKPGAIEGVFVEEVQRSEAGQKSIVIEADWMTQQSETPGNDYKEEACVLAKIDLTEIQGRRLNVRAFLHPSLRVRIVPTEEAPARATIPASYVQQVHQFMRGPGAPLKDDEQNYSKELLPYKHKDNPEGTVFPSDDCWADGPQMYFMDVCFASLGWISFSSEQKFGVLPHCVKGSIFSRRQALYRSNAKWDEEDDLGDYVDKEEAVRRLRSAMKEGKHQKRRDSFGGDDLWDEDDMFY